MYLKICTSMSKSIRHAESQTFTFVQAGPDIRTIAMAARPGAVESA